MRLFLFLTIPLYVLDQVTKIAIVRNFVEHESRPVIEGFFNLVRVHNRGIAFGTFNEEGSAANLIFTIVAVTALVGIAIFWKRGAFPGKLNGTAVALLMSGILGNLTDRLYHGYVVDFLDFAIAGKHWPSFNVADSCICVAAGLLFIAAFRADPEKDKKNDAEPEDDKEPAS
jgi:signal peptidase II